MSFSFIHAADIHLDSPLKGLEKYEGAPVEEIRNATRVAFKNLVNLAIEKHVAFLVIAGDLYDGDWKDYYTGLFFISQMTRLQKAGINVYLIRGNHDAQSLITKELKLPDNVREFSVHQPETEVDEQWKVAVHGQGFVSRSVTDNLAKDYPERLDGYLNIGILHTSATGREGHENYAPCSIEELVSKRYDYWALGHVHLREVLHEHNPAIVFPGNIQGRHIRETGDKGCTIVHVKDGQIESFEHRSLDVLRWEICDVDASLSETMDDVMEEARLQLEQLQQTADGRLLAVRFHIIGASPAHQSLTVEKDHVINNLRSLALEIGNVWVEKVKIKTTRLIGIDHLQEQHTPVATILSFLESVKEDEDTLELLLDEFKDIQNALPYELKNGEDGFDFTESETIKARLKEVENLILHHIQTKAGV
ncbi:DNA repair exonuclease family protein YhaO [Gracilibacillus boraciitolerans JCM 21714]|uniref:DNA repair exonuclease family protein YhaO n=1 Tax=Gracilibacillus boraciitolerans JCM 21714 TaxID=1298598 RepID=W4VD20_9BACI|nr:DNA repair exonuclease [Gracilibacillus boraciitolerans]GAE91097.1 DNA repair exonuclease family protein YhaO [Gracilibacillus boraciitolerans JCM 21714]